MDDDQQLLSWLIFQQLPKQTDKLAHQLLQCFTLPQQLLQAEDLQGVPVEMQSAIRSLQKQGQSHPLYQQAEQIAAQAEKERVHILTLDSPHYPALLAEIHQPPILLYVKGHITCLQNMQLAVVGSRKSSPLANQISQQWSEALSLAGLSITSGLALGVDGHAHQGALQAQGTTIAVLAHGMDKVYPARHKKLAEAIIEKGALVTEFGFNQPPRREHFPQRNRIISGLSLAVLVVEAALKSGSLITARYAMEQNRDVLAVPGAVNNVMAKGCHHLIKQGAQLVENCDDILQALALPISFTCQREENASECALSAESILILKVLSEGPMHINELQILCDMDSARLASELTLLELEEKVANSGGYYQKLLP